MSEDRYDRLYRWTFKFGCGVVGFWAAFVILTLPLGWLMQWDQPSMIVGTLALSPISTYLCVHHGWKWFK